MTWNFKEGFSDAENRENAKMVKAELEALGGCVDGIEELRVIIDVLPSGNRDVVLTSLFESEEVLAAYQVHPEHVRVSSFVGTVLKGRACVDYFE